VTNEVRIPYNDPLREAIRSVRAEYDKLSRGQKATLRRCRSEGEVELEGVYWRLGGALAHQRRHMAGVILLFPLSSHTTNDRFAFGRYLHSTIGDTDTAALRFRRVLDCRDPEELIHRLRGILKLASREHASVDWGSLGSDILSFFNESGAVRRRWAQDYYAPLSRGITPSTTTSPVTHI
jgi:CRISPR type I-E-associated protein CasB/Cse2